MGGVQRGQEMGRTEEEQKWHERNGKGQEGKGKDGKVQKGSWKDVDPMFQYLYGL